MVNNINELTKLLLEYGFQAESLQIIEDQKVIIALASSPKGNKIPLVFQINQDILFISSRDFITRYPMDRLVLFFELAFKLVGYKFYTHPAYPKTENIMNLDISTELVVYPELPKDIFFGYIDIFFENIDDVTEDLVKLDLVKIQETEIGSDTLLGS